jgi:hypothetical protein
MSDQWRYDKLQRKWTTELPPEKITEPAPVAAPPGTAYGDWPRCVWALGCTIGVKDGGLCSPHQDLVLAYGHDPAPDPAATCAYAWQTCTLCGARTTWHRRLTELEGAAVEVFLEDNPTYRLTPSEPSAQVMAMEAERERLAAEHTYVRTDAKPTAVAAAAKAAPGSGTQRGRVLRCIVLAGEEGATDEQIHERLALPLNTVRPRRLELVEGGYVIDSGDTRPTHGGSPAICWLATLDGIRATEGTNQ